MKEVFFILIIILFFCLANRSSFGIDTGFYRGDNGQQYDRGGESQKYIPTYSTASVVNYINQIIGPVNENIVRINAAFKNPKSKTPPKVWISKLYGEYLPGNSKYKDITAIRLIDTKIVSISGTTSSDTNNVVYYINNILVPRVNELYKDPRIINYYTGSLNIRPMTNFVYSLSATHPNICTGGPPCDAMVYLQNQYGFTNLWYILFGVINFIESELIC